VREFVVPVAAGVLVQAALLAAVSGLPPHHPATATTAFRLLVVGVVGGFVVGVVATSGHASKGAVAGAVTGFGVGVGFWWQIFHAETVGVFHHLHYVVASTRFLIALAEYSPHLVVAGVDTVVALTLAVGSYVGGRAAVDWQ
jgi:hypothetical protein